MKHICVSAVSLTVFGLVLSNAHADIVGFGDYSQFTINQRDGAAPPIPVAGGIQLNTLAPSESRSIFYNTPQSVTQFTASFTYQMSGSAGNRMGACFVIQRTSAGVTACAAPSVSGVGTNYGYTDFYGTFNHSVALSLEINANSFGTSTSAVYHDAGVGGGSAATGGVNLGSGHPIAVTVSYSGTIFSVHMADTVTGSTYDSAAIINIQNILGASTGYVGFVAATQANGGAGQTISNFTYAVPTPAAGGLLGLGLLAVTRRRR